VNAPFDPVAFGVPQEALPRLGQNRVGAPDAVFSSNLSVNEYLLLRDAGFRPVGFVLGSSVYHLGFQFGNWNQNMELGVLSSAMYNARGLAMSRMEAEAIALGADGIVNVQIEARRHEWGPEILEFVAVGTAVVADDPPANGTWRDRRGRPFTANLGLTDFWTLIRSGNAPVGFVLGVCVYHVAHQSLAQTLRNQGQNQELPQFTQAFYSARELAMGRMHGEARERGAQGVVNYAMITGNHMWGHHATEFLSVGTAIRQVTDAPDVPLVLPVGLSQVTAGLAKLGSFLAG
jgi:uncharacterized protein YbjQ (UPF0145 family)